MSLRRAGFFRELRHGDPDGPSLWEAALPSPAADQDDIVRYLDGGDTVAATGVLVDDVLDSSRTAVAPLELATDGAWVWPRDLAYYVRQYNVTLPEDFVSEMRRRAWQPPALSDEDLMDVAARVRAG
jgi:hypothetical protein